MKFCLKITLCMLGLLSVLFGVGGSLLLSTSYRNSLEREQDALFNAYQMVLGTLQILNSMNGLSNYADLSRTLEQLSGQNTQSWKALRLYTMTEQIYEYGSPLPERLAQSVQPGSCTIRYLSLGQAGHTLVLAGTLEAGKETLYLDMVRDVTPLFETRRMQQQTYLWVFLLMAALCALLSYSIARFLTNPLVRLSQASRAIATGDLSSRAQVSGQDEVGLLARDFNVMAETLEENISQLKNSVERQERFMGSFAHEAKTPMTSIIGYADLIRGQTLSEEEQIEAANYIVSEGKRLENLSQKLLDILVLQRNAIVLIPVQPAALIQGLAAHLAPLYQQHGITTACDCEEGTCLLEPDLIKSLLTNLWDNARKAMAGRGGQITVCSAMLPDGCRIAVQDTGRGIPPAALEHLTEAFYRVDTSRAREQGGVGLGLSLCREIAALHHGSIRFESQLEQGTTVIVELRGGRP